MILFFSVNISVDAKTQNICYNFEQEYYEKNYARAELATKIEGMLFEKYDIKDPYNDKYPDFFGGMYLDDTADHLIIQVVKEKIGSDYDFFKEITNLDDSIVIEYVSNSFNELNDTNNYIGDNMSKIDKNILGTYIDVRNNAVSVDVDKKILKSKNLFDIENNLLKSNRKIDNKKIKIEYTTASSSYSPTYINAGGYINVNAGSCSMGFRTKYNNKKGYVTAGHCAVGSTTFPTGSIKLSQFKHNQKYDYAFVQTYSSYEPTNNLAYPNSSNTVTKLAVVSYCPAITVNLAIAKSGNTTFYTTGKVLGLNQTVNYKDENNTVTTIKGLVKSNVNSYKGDSGAVVFIPRTDANGGAVPIGILSGGGGGIMYFTSINTLPASLQTGRY